MCETSGNNNLLNSVKFKCIVSSVLNRDTKQHGKNFMFDKEEDTSWSSDQGTPQIIHIHFEEPQNVESFRFQFQGGFAGKDSRISIQNNDGIIIYDEPFYPDDINSVQNFKLNQLTENVSKMKFIFNCSTDFFGRIIVYKLQVY